MKIDSLKRIIKENKIAFGLMLIMLGLIVLVLPVPLTISKEVSLPYSTQYTQDSSIELHESQVRQPGAYGHGIEKMSVIKPIFSFFTNTDFTYATSNLPTETTSQPVPQIVANGTKKYQFMLCSDGTYRYYSNEQFAEPQTGFTHKSSDSCSESNHGHMTSLSESAPQPVQQSTRTVYTPTYTPSYSPTHCYTQYNTYGGYFDPTASTTCY